MTGGGRGRATTLACKQTSMCKPVHCTAARVCRRLKELTPLLTACTFMAITCFTSSTLACTSGRLMAAGCGVAVMRVSWAGRGDDESADPWRCAPLAAAVPALRKRERAPGADEACPPWRSPAQSSAAITALS